MQQNEGNARVQTGETQKNPNKRHLPLAPLAARVPRRRVHTPFPRPLSLQLSNLSDAARALAWIKGVQWTWHCTPTGRHPSSSVTLS